MEARLKYWDLGRSNVKGNVVLKGDTAEEINLKIRDEFGKYLLSSDVSFDNGKIYAGFRCVGEYIVIGDIS